MIRTKRQCRLDIHHRIARQHASAHRFAQPFFHRRDVLARHHAAFGRVFKHETAPRLQRFKGQHHVAVLPFTAGLADKLAFHLFDRFADRLAIGHLRTPDIRLNAKLSLHAVDDNLQMQLAHPGNDRLAGLLVSMQTKRRIFRRQPLQGDTHFLLIGFGFRFNRQRNHRLRELHPFEGNHRIRGAQRVAGSDILQADAGGNIPGVQFVHLMAIVGLHQHDASDAFFLAFHRIPHRIAFFQRPGIDADKGQLSDIGVGHQLEGQRRERFVVVRVTFSGLPFLIHALNRRDIQRRWHQLNHRIEHPLHAFVFKRAAAQHRLDFALHRTLAQSGNDFRLAQLAGFEILIHQFVVGFRRRRDHFLPPQPGGFHEIVRHRRIAEGHPLGGVVPQNGAHFDEIHHPGKVLFGANRDHNRYRIGL